MEACNKQELDTSLRKRKCVATTITVVSYTRGPRSLNTQRWWPGWRGLVGWQTADAKAHAQQLNRLSHAQESGILHTETSLFLTQ